MHSIPTSALLLGSLLLSPSLAALPPVPPELYASWIPQRLLATAKVRTPPQADQTYPQWTKTPPYGNLEGIWQYFPTDTWTSGFLPATLMLMYERFQKCTSGELIKQNEASQSLDLGRAWSAPLTTLETRNNVKHDVGFISFPFWSDLTINPGNTTAAQHVNAFAAYLAGRFNPTVGCTRSWETLDLPQFQVIIDNMINLELFFISADLTGNDAYRQMAISHANKTRDNHIRPDGSTYHVVVYNSETGAVMRQQTAQGFADNSTWSRGRGWAMYGFTSMFNRTGMTTYLDTARRLSTWYIEHLPTDNLVPYWDFNAPGPYIPRDTSSAALAASALLFLADMEERVQNAANAEKWRTNAINLLRDTVSLALRREPNTPWQALLSNGTANKPNNNFDTGLTYGDYYFIKAGNMLLDYGLADCRSASGQYTPNWNGSGPSPGASGGSGTTDSAAARLLSGSFGYAVSAGVGLLCLSLGLFV